MNFEDPPPPPPPPPPPTRQTIPSSEALAQTLYLLERFGVSDEFYHELAMAHPSLPRSLMHAIFTVLFIVLLYLHVGLTG